MRLDVWLLRLVHPIAERERMALRMGMAELQASAHDLTRTTLILKDSAELSKATADYRKGQP